MLGGSGEERGGANYFLITSLEAREQGLTVTFKGMPTMTQDLWLFPTSQSFCHFLKVSYWRLRLY